MTISSDDRGLLLGDGLFETLLALDGRLVDFEAHALRMGRGCAVLGLPSPGDDDLWQAAEEALRSADLTTGRAAVRLTWTAGAGGRGLDRPDPLFPRLVAAAAPNPLSTDPARLVTVSVRRNADSPASRIKSLSYLDNVLARREARAAGADEGLMLNTRGDVACATAANLFWLEGERLTTPSLACGVLDGTVRGRVLEAARSLGVETAEVAVAPAALERARGLFLTNSLIGVRAVSELDGRDVARHPLVERFSEAVGP